MDRHSGARAKRASPESITTTGSMDSGPAPSGASRNDELLFQISRHAAHPLGGQIVGGKERLQRQLRQRDIDRRAENHRGGNKAQDLAIEPHLEGYRDI